MSKKKKKKEDRKECLYKLVSRPGNLINLSLFLCKILRHHPEIAGVSLDEHGWADVDRLIVGVNKANETDDFSKETLEKIVELNNLHIFEFSPSKSLIRANMGHTVNVDTFLAEYAEAGMLYHCTTGYALTKILKYGLSKIERENVQLFTDYNEAERFSQDYNKPVILGVDADQMRKDGYKIYKSKYKCCITEEVPANYITVIQEKNYLLKINVIPSNVLPNNVLSTNKNNSIEINEDNLGTGRLNTSNLSTGNLNTDNSITGNKINISALAIGGN